MIAEPANPTTPESKAVAARDLPLVPLRKDHWLRGCYRALLADPSTFYSETAGAHGGLARFQVFHKIFHAVSDPEAIHQILVTRQKNYRKGVQYENAEILLGRGLVTERNQKIWAAQRKVVAPGFHRKAIANLVAGIHAHANRRFDQWERPGADPCVPMVSEMRAITQEVISETLFATPVETMQAARFSNNIMEATLLFTKKNWSILRVPNHWPSPLNHRLNRLRREITDFLETRIQARLENGLGQTGDVLDMLLLAQQDPEQDKSLLGVTCEQMLTLFAAGFDTTSSSLAWTTYYLATHPEIQARVQEEVDALALAADGIPTWEQLESLTWTHWAFQEALRLHPPVHTIARTAAADDALGGYRIPAGSQLLLSIYGAHRSPRHWPDPETYRPERFAPESQAEFPKQAYFPFSLGSRRCIGALYAEAEAKLVLISLFRRFHLTLQPGTQIEGSKGSALYPKNLMIATRPRSAG